MKSLISILLIMTIHAPVLKVVEIVGPGAIAQRYMNADLVIIGNVISRKTETIKESRRTHEDGWTRIDKTLVDVYTVQVDSVLKGESQNPVLTIQSNPFSGGDIRIEFDKVNEDGDSIFIQSWGIGPGYRAGADLIHNTGIHIILIRFDDDKNISTLSLSYSKKLLDFLKRVDEKGMDAVIPRIPDK
jgi:hypothetical protein